jgi:hypothetical protein
LDTLAFATKPTTLKDFNAIKISLASPEKIRSWSFYSGGEKRGSNDFHLTRVAAK